MRPHNLAHGTKLGLDYPLTVYTLSVATPNIPLDALSAEFSASTPWKNHANVGERVLSGPGQERTPDLGKLMTLHLDLLYPANTLTERGVHSARV